MEKKEEFNGHGYLLEKAFSTRGSGGEIEGDYIYIGNIPGRKQVCLYTETNGEIEILAFFKTPKQAQAALNWLDRLAGGKLSKKTVEGI